MVHSKQVSAQLEEEASDLDEIEIEPIDLSMATMKERTIQQLTIARTHTSLLMALCALELQEL